MMNVTRGLTTLPRALLQLSITRRATELRTKCSNAVIAGARSFSTKPLKEENFTPTLANEKEGELVGEEKPKSVKPLGEVFDHPSIDIYGHDVPALPYTNKQFLKKLFVGTFDTDMLTFPEVATNKDLEDLEDFCKPYEEFFSAVDPKIFFSDKPLPAEFVTAMAEIGLFAQAIPKSYGGLGLDNTYLTRMADITGAMPSANILIEVHHNLATSAICKYGTEEQKKKYLPKLATGEILASLCVNESKTQFDFQSLKSSASVIFSSDSNLDCFSLVGFKTWVPNADITDLFLVVAKSPLESNGQWKGEGLSMFLVESNREGINIGDRIEGVQSPRGLPLFDVTFNNVRLEREDMLGPAGDGDMIAIRTMTNSSHLFGASSACLLRKFTNMLLNYLTTEKIGDVPLYENQSFQAVLCELQIVAYVMESMAYMTGQVLDEFEAPDFTLEQAATRIWCVESLHSILDKVMQVIGIISYEKDHPLFKAYIDTLALKNYPIPLDLLKQYIGLSGIQHAIQEKGEIHKSIRDRLNNPRSVLKKVFLMREYQPPHTLYKYVHDLLHPATNSLEDLCFKFENSVEEYLLMGPRSGSLLQEQYQLNRIAWIISELYAMTAVISHASRSLCLGVQYNDHEGLMAQLFVQRRYLKVVEELEVLEYCGSIDADYFHKMAREIIEAKEYIPRNPLTRSF